MMSRLKTRVEQELQDQTLSVLEATRVKGTLAPVYLQMANSEVALQAYLQMEAALRHSGLSLQEIEAIKLTVSQHNQCDYCLSVHTVKSRAAGLDETQQLAIRKGEALTNARMDAVVGVTRRLLRHPGSLPAEQLQQLREAGLDDRQMVDIALAISTISFTNWFNHFNDSKAPFAPAPNID